MPIKAFWNVRSGYCLGSNSPTHSSFYRCNGIQAGSRSVWQEMAIYRYLWPPGFDVSSPEMAHGKVVRVEREL